MEELYRIESHPLCPTASVVQGERYRISVLTPRLFRLEYSEDGVFEDRPTQCVLNRDFATPAFQVFETEDTLKIVTEGVQLLYDKQKFSPSGLSVTVKAKGGSHNGVWHYGDEVEDLGGTARTLDTADGAIPLEHGLLSRWGGFGVLDDSKSLLIRSDGWVEPRQGERTDLYFFGYGPAYQDCLRDFYHLTGPVPLLPRFVFGNWWSRYHRYDEQEYKALIRRFEAEQIPFSVAVIDMDWHLVDVDPKYGSGWTGYTWNRELFPDPAEFMGWLHRHGLKVTLNVHPADGVRPFEEAYRPMAQALGLDWSKEEPIPFDSTDPAFLEAYFQYLHHPNEEMGVDFWWVDWQQGTHTRIPGLDPLWMLNHYHYLDSMRGGKRGLTFSRYSGPGSHRYPIGFSGDTIISWKSLDFQPYFTANASNIGYGWWSHDIGGHMQGSKDDELSTRWVQFGVFSPIMRLHSSNSRFTGKEPWNYNLIAQTVMKRYLRLRHQLVPYLYTMNVLASRQGQPLIRPLYYLEPQRAEAYSAPNEYYFGTQLLVCPITTPMDKKAGAAPFEAWLPAGRWFDLFEGRIYDGGRKLTLYRSLEDIPVLARAGAILPMARLQPGSSSTDNPACMEVRVFPGADGSFELYEDDGISIPTEGSFAVTRMTWEQEAGCLTVGPVEGNRPVVPARRSYAFCFYGVGPEAPRLLCNGQEAEAAVSYDPEKHILTLEAPAIRPEDRLQVQFGAAPRLLPNDLEGQLYRLLYQAEMKYDLKEQIFGYLHGGMSAAALLGVLQTMHLDEAVYGMLAEVLLAQTN